jgi:hypothetical protein
MQPSVALLNPQPDAPFSLATVRITNRLEQPLLLSSPQNTNSALRVELKTNVFGQNYALTISNTVPLPPGAHMSLITLKTSLTDLPTLRVPVLDVVSPTFTVEPGQITLAGAPLLTNQVSYVTMVNNSTNPVSLSDPRVSAIGVDASLKETKPGAAFTAIVSFPAGFKLPAGATNALSVRTSHPQCPVIEVPILWASNAAPAAPFVSRTGPHMVTARLPLVFQTEAMNSLKLGEEQLKDIADLRKQFIEEIGGLSQDPSDSAYLARWQKARPKVDALLTGVVGQRALVRFDTSGDASETISQ